MKVNIYKISNHQQSVAPVFSSCFNHTLALLVVADFRAFECQVCACGREGCWG